MRVRDTGIGMTSAEIEQALKPFKQINSLKNEAGSIVGGAHAGPRKALVVSQVTLSLLLLIAAGLFVRSLHNLMSVNHGIEASRLIEFFIQPSLIGYEDEGD